MEMNETAAYSFKDAPKAGKLTLGQCFQSKGTVTVKGETIHYHTDAQDYVFLDDEGQPEASMFVISQFRDGGDASRPVLFVFNGGPGCSSADMYATMYGPKTLDMNDDFDLSYNPPYPMKDNDNWLIDVCDIVLFDTVGTGYGQLIQPEAAPKYYGVEQDAYALSRVIRRWLAKYHRFNSPKYINGVSYGSVRCAFLPAFLMGGALHPTNQAPSVMINGIIPMGSSNYLTDLYYHRKPGDVTFDQLCTLKTCAANHHYYHPEGKPEQDQFIDEAGKWGNEVFLPFLQNIDHVSQEERESVAEALSGYIGLPKETLLEMDFNYDAYAYLNTYMAAENKSLAMYDSRISTDGIGIATPTFDPIFDDGSLARFWSATGAVTQDLLARDLGVAFGEDREYIVQNFDNIYSMNYQVTNDVSVCDMMAGVLRHNQEMRALYVIGRYDFCCPMANTEHEVYETGLPQDRVELLKLNCGHEVYYTPESRNILTERIREFIR